MATMVDFGAGGVALAGAETLLMSGAVAASIAAGTAGVAGVAGARDATFRGGVGNAAFGADGPGIIAPIGPASLCLSQTP